MLEAKQIADNLCSPGIHIIDDFLDEQHFRALYQIAHEHFHQGAFRQARIGQHHLRQNNHTIRTDQIFWLDEQSTSPSVQAYLMKANDLARILNETLFLCLNEFETHFAIYQPGNYYKLHVDQFTTTKSRKISCVYYLNPEWQLDFGGELKIYDCEHQLIQSILPQGNRFVCFNSELPHEVCITHQPRYSLTGWMKRVETLTNK